MLYGPARTDRFGPSVLVITASSEAVNQYTFNDPQQLLSKGVSPWPPSLSQPDRERRRLAWAVERKGQLGNGTTEDMASG